MQMMMRAIPPIAFCLFLVVQIAEADPVKKPKRKMGQACESDSHCKKKLICWEHKCAPKRKLGEPCRRWTKNNLTEESDCKEPLNCWGEVSEAKCAPRRKVGETCAGNRAFRSDCAKGAKCVMNKDHEFECSKGKKGQACSFDNDCRGQLVCVQGSCQ